MKTYVTGDVLVRSATNPVPPGWTLTADLVRMWRYATEAGTTGDDTAVLSGPARTFDVELYLPVHISVTVSNALDVTDARSRAIAAVPVPAVVIAPGVAERMGITSVGETLEVVSVTDLATGHDVTDEP